MSDPINAAELSRLNSKVDQILNHLRQPRPEIYVGGDMVGRDKLTAGGHIVIAAAGSQVTINAPDLMALGALQREADLRRREEIYLIRFICDETYARWGHDYVPLAGDLRPPGRPSDDLRPAMRYYDRQDANASPAGQHLEDIREAIGEYHKTKLILLGQPGAGKTTTLYRLALDFALERVRDPALGKLPLSLNLANFRKVNELPAEFLRAHLEATGLGLSYGEAIAYRQVCFLLDGLNQMPADDRNERIDAWRRWASEPELPREIVAIFACRLADYVPRLGLPEVHVQSLDNDRIQKYFHLRFGPETGQKHWRTLHDRLRTGDKLFEDLARNPMMLSKLAERAEEGLSLADSKGIILEDAALRRLDYELGSDNQPPALTANPRRTLREEMDALGRIAYEVQALGEGTVFDDAKLEAVLLAKGASLTRAQVKKLAIDSTLLTAHGPENTEPYEFQHQLFQEYFAARELLRRFRAGEDLKGLWEVDWLAPDRGPDDDGQVAPPPATRWDETVIMAGGLAREDAPRLIAAIRADHPPLAGRALAEARPDERDDLQELAKELRAELLARQRDTNARLRARIGAGLALGELGHPDLRPQPFEFEGRTVWAVAPPLQPVPAGEFIRGSEPNDKRAYQDEFTNERRVTLNAFSIGRYPVTNAEYRFFVEADGYGNERWWSEAGLKWKAGGADAHGAAIEQWMGDRAFLQGQKNLEAFLIGIGRTPATIRYWKEVTQLSEDEARKRARQQFSRSFDRPAFWEDPTFNSPARPVVGVNWHEAEAYCRWLSAVTGRDYRLPGEMEWEKAARGTNGRQYPWEGEFDSARCNTNESRILVTTPVGLYPDGKSPFEVYDASGNVWEWTADWYQMYPGGEPSEDFDERFKVVRGGSWDGSGRNARCAYRFRSVPVYFDNDLGFRLLSPVS
jgi:formylglycine-generating enzyme required for sulfatase activity